MKIAFVTTKLFEQPGNGGEMCTARLMDALVRAGHSLHLVGRGKAPPAGPGSDLVSAHSVGEAIGAFDSLARWRQAGALLGAWAHGRASTVHRLSTGGTSARVAQVLAALGRESGGPPDAVVADHLQALAWLPAGLELPVLLMMHNLEAEGYDERADLALVQGRRLHAAVYRREARLLHALQALALRRAAAVACLSEADAGILRRLALAVAVRPVVEVLPGFPLGAGGHQPSAPARAPVPGTRRIGLLGTWTWEPNREGLVWMLSQVFPLLPAGCTLTLAGRGLETVALPAAPAGRIVKLGWIEDPQRFYDSVDVVALPSWSGSGVHEKSIEALVRSRVVVATPHALRGLGTPLPPHVHVAERPQDFATLCALAGPGPEAAAATVRWAQQRRALYDAAVARCVEALAASRDRVRCAA
jgi:hypothetical protein